MVSIMLWQSPHYPLDRRMGGPQSHCGWSGKEKSPCPCQESNPHHPVCSLVTILSELSWLLVVDTVLEEKWINSNKHVRSCSNVYEVLEAKCWNSTVKHHKSFPIISFSIIILHHATFITSELRMSTKWSFNQSISLPMISQDLSSHCYVILGVQVFLMH